MICRWLLAISLQVNAVLEEMLGWRALYLQSDTMADNHTTKLELLRPTTRFSIVSEQTIIKLTNARICPVAAWIPLSVESKRAAGQSCNLLRTVSHSHMLATFRS